MSKTNFEFNLYAIKDRLNGFGSISIDSNDDTAIRNFAYALQAGVMSYAAADYELYRIGTYNINSGLIESIQPDFVASGIECKAMYK